MKTIKRAHQFPGYLLFVFLLLQGGNTFASTLGKADSSILPQHSHRLGKQQFLTIYGRDDSSRALIKYYYPKRKTGIILSGYSGSSLVIAGILSAVIIYSTAGANFLAFLLVLTLLAAAYVAAFLLIAGLVMLLLHSRRRLKKMLLLYFTGEPIPERIRKKDSFQRLVKKEQNNP
jgi:hypothetical protein